MISLLLQRIITVAHSDNTKLFFFHSDLYLTTVSVTCGHLMSPNAFPNNISQNNDTPFDVQIRHEHDGTVYFSCLKGNIPHSAWGFELR